MADDNQRQEIQNQEQRPDDQKDQAPPESPEKKSRRKFIVIAVVILLVIGGALFYWHSTFSEDTDDAQVDGDLYEVSSRDRAGSERVREGQPDGGGGPADCRDRPEGLPGGV